MSLVLHTECVVVVTAVSVLLVCASAAAMESSICQRLHLISLNAHLAHASARYCNLDSPSCHTHTTDSAKACVSYGLLSCMLLANNASLCRAGAAEDHLFSAELGYSFVTACRGIFAAAVEGQDSVAILHCSPSGQLKREQTLSLTGVLLPTQVHFDGANQLWAVGGPFVGSHSAICLGVATFSDQQKQVCILSARCQLGSTVWCEWLVSPACCSATVIGPIIFAVACLSCSDWPMLR